MRIFFSLKVLNNEAINFLKLLYFNFCAVIPTLLKDINGISGVKEMEIACLLNETLSMTKNILKLSKYIVKECDAAVLNKCKYEKFSLSVCSINSFKTV